MGAIAVVSNSGLLAFTSRTFEREFDWDLQTKILVAVFLEHLIFGLKVWLPGEALGGVCDCCFVGGWVLRLSCVALGVVWVLPWEAHQRACPSLLIMVAVRALDGDPRHGGFGPRPRGARGVPFWFVCLPCFGRPVCMILFALGVTTK